MPPKARSASIAVLSVCLAALTWLPAFAEDVCQLPLTAVALSSYDQAESLLDGQTAVDSDPGSGLASVNSIAEASAESSLPMPRLASRPLNPTLGGGGYPPSARSDSSSFRDRSIDEPDGTYAKRNLFRRVINDQKFLVTRWWPAEFGRRGFTYPLLATISLAVGSTREDASVDQSLERNTKSEVGRHGTGLAHGMTSLGNASTGAALVGAAYLIGRWTHNDRLSETSSLSAEAILDAGIWITVLKGVTARTRPSSGGTGDFFQYKTHGGQENGSFPSGHAMGAFALATVFAHEYADKKWVPWVAYGTASLISASRVGLGRHYPSDVIAGGVLGNSIGRMVVSRAHGEDLAPPGGRVGPIFDSTGHGVGIGYTYSW